MDIRKQSTIFIRNFATRFDSEKQLRDGFERFGSIESVRILQTPQNHLIGYVEFKDKESAHQAIERVDGLVLPNGTSMRAGIVKECNDSINNLYIKNVPDCVTNDVLESLFKDYGPIVSATIMKNGEGKSRGFGFVCFKNDVDAAVAKKDMNGFEISGKKFDISFAQKKENREAYLTAQKKGLLKEEGEVAKPRLPLERRIVRRPTQLELQSYCSVPHLEQIDARMFSNSFYKIPTMCDVMQRPYPPPATNYIRQDNKHYNQHHSAQKQSNMRPFRSQANLSSQQQQSKSHNTGAVKKQDKVGSQPKPPVQKQQKDTLGSAGQKAVLQELLLPQLKRIYPTYAAQLLKRMMEREYKDILRLVKNHRLLYKAANSEVQKIKAQSNGPKRP